MTRRQPCETSSTKHKKNKPVLKIVLLLAVVAGLLSIASLLLYAALGMPAFDPQQLSGANNSHLYDQNEKEFASLHAGENRTDVSLEQVPPQLVQAFIAIEDRAFYEHHGINIQGIARAVFQNVQSGDMTAQGASTITQQLARNSFLSADKNWLRKIREAMLAFQIEANYSKDEIMEMYLNRVYYGAGAYGAQAAAKTYFGKDVSQLSLSEAALLAGLVQSPNSYNPFTNLDRATERQKLVLNSMVDCGFIDRDTADQNSAVPLQFARVTAVTTQFGYFADAVIDEAIQVLAGIPGYKDAENAVYKGGLNIYTTLNAPLQAYAEEFFRHTGNFPSGKKDGPQIQAGMVIVENGSGAVQAIMGGREYSQQRGFNRATSAYRQPGSSIKPLTVYSTALEKGKMPFTILKDAPVSYQTAIGTWTPKNYDNQYRGSISMRTAVKYSVNTYAVQLMDQVGIQSGFDMGQSLGLSLVDSDRNLAALALGGLTKGVTPLQMAGAYSTFANTGLFNPPHLIKRIEEGQGVVVYEFQPGPHRVMTEQTAWSMNNMLQTVVESGTGTRAKVPNVPTGGKTGTTDDLTDVWFCGITPLYAGAIWMGYDDPQNKMVNVAGGGYPALMFKAMMQKAHQGRSPGSWTMPSDIGKVTICSESNKRATEYCPAEQLTTYYSLTKYVAPAFCDLHNKETAKLDAQELQQRIEKICIDPRHQGTLYKANISASTNSGGCPNQYVTEMVIAGKPLQACTLTDHQLKENKRLKSDSIQ